MCTHDPVPLPTHPATGNEYYYHHDCQRGASTQEANYGGPVSTCNHRNKGLCSDIAEIGVERRSEGPRITDGKGNAYPDSQRLQGSSIVWRLDAWCTCYDPALQRACDICITHVSVAMSCTCSPQQYWHYFTILRSGILCESRYDLIFMTCERRIRRYPLCGTSRVDRHNHATGSDSVSPS